MEVEQALGIRLKEQNVTAGSTLKDVALYIVEKAEQ